MSSGAAANANSGVENPGSGNGQKRAAGRTQARAAKDSRQTTAVQARPVRGKTTPKNRQTRSSTVRRRKSPRRRKTRLPKKAAPPENRARSKARTKTARKTIKKTMRPRKKPKPRSKNCSAPSAVLSLRKKNWRSSSGIWAGQTCRRKRGRFERRIAEKDEKARRRQAKSGKPVGSSEKPEIREKGTTDGEKH